MSKIIIDRELLLDKVNKVYKFVPSKSIIPALDNIKFEVNGNTMLITAFNGEIQCQLSCSVKAKENMSFCLPAKLFVGIIRLLRENELTITIGEKKATLKCGKSVYNISVNTTPDIFPFIKNGSHENEMVMLQSAFKDYASKVSNFAGDNATLPWMSGMNMAFSDKKEMTFTSATNFVMCRAIAPVISLNKWKSVTIPVSSVKRITELCNKGEMTIMHSENIMVFSSAANSDEQFTIIATCINENYPNVSNFFSAPREKNFVINVSEGIDCINRVKLCSNQLLNSINLNLQASELTISSSDEDFGNDGTEVVSVTNEKNVTMDKNLVSDQMVKILGSIDEVECFIYWSDKDNIPLLIQGKTDFVNFQFLTTPLK